MIFGVNYGTAHKAEVWALNLVVWMYTRELWLTEIMCVINKLFNEDSSLQLSYKTEERKSSNYRTSGAMNTIDIIYERRTTNIQIRINEEPLGPYSDYLKTALIQAGALQLDFSQVENLLAKASIDMIVKFFLDTNTFVLRGITNFFYQKAKTKRLSFILLYATPLIKNELGRIFEKNKDALRTTAKSLHPERKTQMKLANAMIGLKEFGVHTSSGLVRTVPVSARDKLESFSIGDRDIYEEYTKFLQRTPSSAAYFVTADRAYSARISSMTPIMIRQDVSIPKTIKANIRALPALIYTMATMFSEIQLSPANNPFFKITFGRNNYSHDVNNPWVNLIFRSGHSISTTVQQREKEILRELEILRALRVKRQEFQRSGTVGGEGVNEIY